MATAASFAAIPNVKGVSFAGPSATPADLIIAGASGTRIDFVNVACAATTVNGTAEVYHHDGTTSFLIATLPIPVTTISAGSVSGFTARISLGISIPTGHKIQVSVTLGANTLKFVGYAADL